MTAHKGKTNFEVVYPFSTREPKNENRTKILFFRFFIFFFLTNEKTKNRFLVSAYFISN